MTLTKDGRLIAWVALIIGLMTARHSGNAVLKHSSPYLNTRFSFKIGADAFRYKPYIGISVGYIYPYDRQTISGSPMLGISLGMQLL